MMPENNLSYEDYLDGLPAARRAEVERVWGLVREHIPAGYTEEIDRKFLSFKAGGEWYVALANQKNYISLHLIPLYVFPEMKAKLDAVASKKLKRGKGCVNFQRAEELPLEVIGEIVGAYEGQSFAEHMREIRSAKRPDRKKVKATN